MKILLSFVGNHDPYNARDTQTPGPILSILAKKRFDRLILLFNNDRYWDALIETQSYCNQHYPQMKVEYRQAASLDPTDYNVVYPAMYQVVHKLQSQFPKGSFTISVTSGTPTMHACWMFLAFSGAINASLIQVSAQRGIVPVTFSLDDFPQLQATDTIKAELTQLARENAILQQQVQDYAKSNIAIPAEGLDFDGQCIPAYYKAALQKSNGNAAAAARLLGLAPHTFRKRLKAYGISAKT